jgi:hypothetical protein
MAEQTRVPTRCDGCGQTDTDPKAHLLNADGTSPSLHFDCLNGDAVVGHGDLVARHTRILEDAGGNRDKLVRHLAKGNGP